jgi:lysophospholipase L1-like esterase
MAASVFLAAWMVRRPATRWLLLIGDSKTAVNSTHPEFGSEQGWQAPLAASFEPPRTWANYGSGSQTVATYAANLRAGAYTDVRPEVAPDAVLLNLGVNDSLIPASFPTQAVWQAAYLSIIDWVRVWYPTAPCYVMRWWSRNATVGHDNTEASWIDTLITLRPLCFLGPDERVFLKGSDNGATNTYDGTHMGTAGHLAVAAAWKAVLAI